MNEQKFVLEKRPWLSFTSEEEVELMSDIINNPYYKSHIFCVVPIDEYLSLQNLLTDISEDCDPKFMKSFMFAEQDLHYYVVGMKECVHIVT